MKKIVSNISKQELSDLYITKKLSLNSIGKIYNISARRVLNSLHYFNIPIRTIHQKDWTGYKGKYLRVINKIKDGSYTDKIWLCKCVCETELLLSHRQLSHNLSCGCMTGRTPTEFNKYLSSECKDLHYYWHFITNDSKRRNIQLSITQQEAYDIFLKQNKKCSFTGILLKLPQSKQRRVDTASLDRIDNNSEYSKNNVHWIHKKLNLIRMGLSVTDFKLWCKLVAIGGFKWIQKNQNIEDTIPLKYWNQTIRNAKKRRLIFNITKEYMYDILLSQNFRCVYTGLPISFSDITASIDRINPLFGYIKDNIQWTHKTINTMKLNFQDKEFWSYCWNVYQYTINPDNLNILRWLPESTMINKKSNYKQYNGPIYIQTDLYPSIQTNENFTSSRE